jgi:hypothetical protein
MENTISVPKKISNFVKAITKLKSEQKELLEGLSKKSNKFKESNLNKRQRIDHTNDAMMIKEGIRQLKLSIDYGVFKHSPEELISLKKAKKEHKDNHLRQSLSKKTRKLNENKKKEKREMRVNNSIITGKWHKYNK